MTFCGLEDAEEQEMTRGRLSTTELVGSCAGWLTAVDLFLLPSLTHVCSACSHVCLLQAKQLGSMLISLHVL